MYSESHELMRFLIDTLDDDTKAFQYFICDTDTSFEDIQFFLNRFIFLAIEREFYLINFHKCIAEVKVIIVKTIFFFKKYFIIYNK